MLPKFGFFLGDLSDLSAQESPESPGLVGVIGFLMELGPINCSIMYV